MGRTFSTIFKNPVLFLGLSAIPFAFLVASSLLALVPGMADSPITKGLGIPFAIFNVIIQGAVAHAAFESFMGNRVTIRSAFLRAASRTGRLILLGLTAGLGIGFSALLFVFPCIILTCMWSVIIPSCVIEGLGVMDSLRRSRSLTKGYKWKILALLSLAGTISMVMLLLVLGVIAVISYIFMGGNPVLLIIATIAAMTFTNAMMNVMVGVAYCSLRSAKEGLVPADLANVFN
jgi:hypothetical protein